MKMDESRVIFIVLVVIQFLLTGYYFNSIFELTKTGAMSIPVFFAFIFGSISLYIGAIRYFLNKKSRGKIFIIALLFLAIAMHTTFQFPFIWTGYVEKFGVLLSTSGWWLSRE